MCSKNKYCVNFTHTSRAQQATPAITTPHLDRVTNSIIFTKEPLFLRLAPNDTLSSPQHVVIVKYCDNDFFLADSHLSLLEIEHVWVKFIQTTPLTNLLTIAHT